MKVHAGPIDGVIVAPADPEEEVLNLQELPEAEIERRVEGLLALKKKLGLYADRITSQAGAEKVVGAPSHREAADKLAEAAIVKLRDGSVVCYGDPRNGPPSDVVAWGGDEHSKRAAARALAGEIPFAGRLPFPLPGA
jgi:beta-glucosidase-like glycosyl hydrolase